MRAARERRERENRKNYVYPVKGDDLRFALNLDLETVCSQNEQILRLPRLVTCSECSGKGFISIKQNESNKVFYEDRELISEPFSNNIVVKLKNHGLPKTRDRDTKGDHFITIVFI